MKVPIGKATAVGIVERVGMRPRPSPLRLRAIREVLDDRPVLDEDMVRLCRWMAHYYLAPLGLVAQTILPPGMLGRQDSRRETPPKVRRRLILTRTLGTLSERVEVFGRAHRQRAAYEVIESMGGAASVAHLVGRLGFGRPVLKGLVDRGLAKFVDEPVERDPFGDDGATETGVETGRGGGVGSRPEFDLSNDQVAAVNAIDRLDGTGRTALLHGVTGSGKTEVYIELIYRQLARGRSAIVLVPEISLTPQTVRRFRARFGDLVAVLHSRLSAGERHDAWRALREGRRRIAIGPRSAVLAPAPELGIIVVDEEHDSSYKQSDRAPRYHARSVAAMRARSAKAICVLGSATPSLESWHNAVGGRYARAALPHRVTPRGLPGVKLVDGQAERISAPGNEASRSVLSEELADAIAARLERDEQTILLLNRRGYSTILECGGCNRVWTCRRCSATLTYHRRRQRMACRYCDFQQGTMARCPDCGQAGVLQSGVGSEQLERQVCETFPHARVARLDSDTTDTKWAHRDTLDSFGRKEIDILVGTQMVAKGLDFPGVTLVGVINADAGLNLPDFRASERTFQLIEQVSGRAGRGDEPGEVLVQTLRPRHPALRFAASHDYHSFVEQELEDRAELGFPPHSRLARLIVHGRSEQKVSAFAGEIASIARQLIRKNELLGTDVAGPAPCPIEKIKNRWRWHILVASARAKALGRVLDGVDRARLSLPGGLRLDIDRDPEALL